MFVELIATGTEIVRGRLPDTNTPHIARRLAASGLDVRFFTTCADNPRDLSTAFRQAIRRADLTIVTGGLGPSRNDYTRAAAAQAVRRPLIFIQSEWRRLRERAAALGRRLPPSNRGQARFPRGADILPNSVGWAAGFLLELRGGRRFAALPGPPREMAPMLETLLSRLGVSPADRFDKAFKIFGIPKSEVEAKAFSDLCKIRGVDYNHITEKGGTISLHLRIRDCGHRETALDRIRSLLRRRFGNAFYGEDDCTLADATASLLLSRRATLAIAESCTGGLVADRLTDVPGISDSLLESLVAYGNESKRRRLGVRTGTLARHGAVSRQTAAAMARGARESAGADLGLSTTGIAGPTGGTAAKPVGLVYFGLADAKAVRVERRVFRGTRRDVKESAADFALDLVRRALLHGSWR